MITDSKRKETKARDVREKRAEEKLMIQRGDIEEIAEYYYKTDTGDFDLGRGKPKKSYLTR